MASVGSELMTVREAAEALSLAPPTIRAWVAQRWLGHVRLGRAIRIKVSEVKRVLEAGEVPPERRL